MRELPVPPAVNTVIIYGARSYKVSYSVLDVDDKPFAYVYCYEVNLR
jgi:hypothetical protein